MSFDDARPDRPVRDYIAALNAHDLQRVLDAFTDDAVVMAPETPTAVGSAAVRALYEARFATYDYARELHIDDVVEHDGLAVARCHTTGTLTLRQNGTAVEAISRELFTLRRGDHGWHIRHYMFNAPAPLPH